MPICIARTLVWTARHERVGGNSRGLVTATLIDLYRGILAFTRFELTARRLAVVSAVAVVRAPGSHAKSLAS